MTAQIRPVLLQLLQAVTGQNPSTVGSKNAVILLCGVAKMLVGELVEEGGIFKSHTLKAREN